MINYTEKGIGLHDEIMKAGHVLWEKDGVWYSTNDEAVQEIIDNYVPPEMQPKIVGFEFEGVMCSATAADQAGLTAVLMAIQVQGQNFPPTRFYFENGNTLVIHLGNYQAFMDDWIPFRQSFFVP